MGRWESGKERGHHCDFNGTAHYLHFQVNVWRMSRVKHAHESFADGVEASWGVRFSQETLRLPDVTGYTNLFFHLVLNRFKIRRKTFSPARSTVPWRLPHYDDSLKKTGGRGRENGFVLLKAGWYNGSPEWSFWVTVLLAQPLELPYLKEKSRCVTAAQAII